MADAPFKSCTLCGFRWPDIASFVVDATLHVNGYQACPPRPELGMVLVTHAVDGCGTTLAVVVEGLGVLYDGPQHERRLTGTEDCRLMCKDPTNIEECTADCDMAWVRHVLQLLRRHELPPHLSPGH